MSGSSPAASTGLAALAAGIAMAALVAACADECADLQVVCDRCVDPHHKASCEDTVDEAVQDACAQGIDEYENTCP